MKFIYEQCAPLFARIFSTMLPSHSSRDQVGEAFVIPVIFRGIPDNERSRPSHENLSKSFSGQENRSFSTTLEGDT